MTTFTEGRRTAEFILHADPISFDEVTISSTAGAMVPGTVLGKMANGKYKAYANANSSGDADAAACILYAGVEDLTTDQKATVVSRLAEVMESRLTGIDAAGKTDLAATFIVCR